MVFNLVQRHAFFGVSLNHTQDEALGKGWKIIRKTYVHAKNVLLNDFFLFWSFGVLCDEWSFPSQQFIDQDAQTPNVKFFIMARFINHFRSQIIDSSTISLSRLVSCKVWPWRYFTADIICRVILFVYS